MKQLEDNWEDINKIKAVNEYQRQTSDNSHYQEEFDRIVKAENRKTNIKIFIMFLVINFIVMFCTMNILLAIFN